MLDEGIEPLPAFIPARESPAGDPDLTARYPLMLLTAKSASNFLNSSYANLPRHLRMERKPMLEMYPDDAANRGIVDGEQVRVFIDSPQPKRMGILSDRH